MACFRPPLLAGPLFIDAQGRIRYHQFGEGQYEMSEMVIQQLLAEPGINAIDQELVSVDAGGVEAAADWDSLRSPGNYVGYDRTENFASPGGARLDERRTYAAPVRLSLNHWALSGEWTVGNQATALTEANGGLRIAFTPAIFISSEGCLRQEPPCDFAC